MNPSAGPSLLIVISAPSGGGKTTLCQNLLAASPRMKRVVTCTTRNPRPGEKDGIDYQFLSRERFLERVGHGEFLEHADVYGNFYGTLRSEVIDGLSAGRDVLLNIDVQGAESVRRKAGSDSILKRALVTVFLTPPTWAELESRLRGRGTEPEEVVQRRLAEARRELAQSPHFDYLLLSGTREEDVRRMQVILEAERLRHSRTTNPVL